MGLSERNALRMQNRGGCHLQALRGAHILSEDPPFSHQGGP